MKNYNIIMTKEVKTKLCDLGVYDKWLNNTKEYFIKIREDSISFTNGEQMVEDGLNQIQEHIYNSNIKKLLFNSFSWVDTIEGSKYWNSLYKSL